MATRKRVHQWLKDRSIASAWIVLRVDDYMTTTASRGQFYPENGRLDDVQKAIWGSESDALSAAQWAAQKFNHKYGVFKLSHFVEQATVPTRVVKV